MIFSNVLDIKFANASIRETVEYAMLLMQKHESAYSVVPDSEMVLEYRRNRRLRSAVSEADLVLPGGNGVVLASGILGTPMKSRITAFDFASALMARMSEKRLSVYIIGSDSNIVEQAEENISRRYPGLAIAGSDDGYYGNDDLIENINSLEPDLVLVCYGTPKQEIWMQRNRELLKCGLLLGLGDGLKVYAGIAKRAPKRWRDSGFEWFYWMIKEPSRILSTLKRVWIVGAALKRRILGY